MYQLHHERNCIAIVDYMGDIIETFDFNEYREAHKTLEDLNTLRTYEVSYLIARAKWITRNGIKIKVPAEELYRRTCSKIARNEDEAIKLVLRGYRASAYVIRDIRASETPFIQ